MYLKAKVLKVEVKKNAAFNERTGLSDPSYFLEADVIDVDTGTRYQCSFRGSLGADLLRKAYADKLPEQERDTLARRVEAEAKQHLENRDVALVVEEVRLNNSFLTLLVRMDEG